MGISWDITTMNILVGAVGIRFYRDDSHKSEYNLSKYGEMEL